ncbi:hypothetical protein [Rubrivivax gelatinosus]|uniref:hypothetical protein n=1 Tax=Rubrivivax gelatinosus TaxID=28068 RepID=UPI001051319E|nr:hypothetical protein [Rubrivivax gelatinosus]MBK1687806.1 hypothetical protein [Rubrivivax gelatinosus]
MGFDAVRRTWTGSPRTQALGVGRELAQALANEAEDVADEQQDGRQQTRHEEAGVAARAAALRVARGMRGQRGGDVDDERLPAPAGDGLQVPAAMLQARQRGVLAVEHGPLRACAHRQQQDDRRRQRQLPGARESAREVRMARPLGELRRGDELGEVQQ